MVLLGDSFASGNGGNDYSGGDCYRSSNCWGKIAATALRASDYDNNACSGSTIGSLRNQDDAISYSTDVVLVGTGSEDLNFEELLLSCFEEERRNRQDCINEINSIDGKLSGMTNNL